MSENKSPILETDRLILRPFNDNEKDFEEFLEYFFDDGVRPFLGGFPPDNREDAAILFKGGTHLAYDWAVELKNEERIIGEVLFSNIVCGYLADIGFLFNRQYWGKGYASEAVKRVTEFGFSGLRLGRIRAETMLANTRSQRLLVKCGFEKEALIYEADFGGKIADVFYYSIKNMGC